PAPRPVPPAAWRDRRCRPRARGRDPPPRARPTGPQPGEPAPPPRRLSAGRRWTGHARRDPRRRSRGPSLHVTAVPPSTLFHVERPGRPWSAFHVELEQRTPARRTPWVANRAAPHLPEHGHGRLGSPDPAQRAAEL